MVNIPIEFYHGFTLEQFFEMKGFEYDASNLRINNIVDIYTNGEHKIEKGESIEIEIRELNTYEQRKDEIQKTIEFIRIAAQEGNQIQIMIN